MLNLLFPKNRYEKKYFWTFAEILSHGLEVPLWSLSNSNILAIANNMTSYTTPVIVNNNWANANFAKVLDLVVNRYKEQYAIFTDTEEFDSNKVKNFIAKLLNILDMTSSRYLALLGVYSSAEGHLLDPVDLKTKGITRFNDTPQDEGDFANDSHTTNLTEIDNTTSNDLDSKMGRIREIEGNYNNVLFNWSKEFDSLFIEEDNI